MNSKGNCSTTILPHNLDELFHDNYYKTIVLISKRASDIYVDMCNDLKVRTGSFVPITAEYINSDIPSDSNASVVNDQSEITQLYERTPKPHIVASNEFLDGELSFDTSLTVDEV